MEIIGDENSSLNLKRNLLINGDNKDIMAMLLKEPKVAGKISMIYIDPPFFSNADYDAVVKLDGESIKHIAYKDSWTKGMEEYLKMFTARLMLMKDLLADDGLIWVHLDWHAVHYARIIMDEIFGEENFVNEIIWQYKSGGSTKKRFSRKHDNILVYSKKKRYRFFPQQEKSYNRDLKPYRFKGVKEYRDEIGWYTMVNMKDVWEIDMVGRTSAERTGYATQKPEQLVERIIRSSSKEGDLVADFFCGSGTLGVMADKMNRKFIMVDKGKLAIETTAGRLNHSKAAFTVLENNPEKKSSVKAKVKFNVDRDPLYEDLILDISIEGIRINGSRHHIEDKYLAKIKELEKNKPMELVMGWSVDYNYDGQVHRPTEIFAKGKDPMPSSCRSFVKKGDTISVKIIDIFGNHQFVYYNVL